ncbi:MAG: hypothetical protein ACLRL6_08855 [Clostridium sp.]
MRNYISTIAKDKIVLIATHVMQDIETIAKEILFIKGENLLFEGSITELIERLKGRVQETLIAEDVWEEFQRTHKITRSLRLDTVFHVRYIVDEVGESSVLPSLECLSVLYGIIFMQLIRYEIRKHIKAQSDRCHPSSSFATFTFRIWNNYRAMM